MRNRCIGFVRFARLSCRVGAMALLVAAWFPAAGARGDSVYRWTDERGVVHFSDSPPPAGMDTKVDNLPMAPSRPTSEGENTGDAPAAGPDEAPPAAAEGAAGDGRAAVKPTRPAAKRPAQVEVIDPQEQAQDGGVREFSGSVKNVGDETARDVVVVISVSEPVQGASCVREEVDVDPPVLKPEQIGSYSVQLENPCFYGPTTTEVTPDWR